MQARVNKKFVKVVLNNTSHKAKYTSSLIQQVLLKVVYDSVQNKICDEARDAKFCILIDELVSESSKSQVAIILRYIDGQILML